MASKSPAKRKSNVPATPSRSQQPSIASFFSSPSASASAASTTSLLKKKGKDLLLEPAAEKKGPIEVVDLISSDEEEQIQQPSTSKYGGAANSSSKRIKLESTSAQSSLPKRQPANSISLSRTSKAGLSSTSKSETLPLNVPEASAQPLDTDPLEFIPSQYPVSSWPNGRAPYSFLTKCLVIVSSTKSRLIIQKTIINFLRVLIEHSPNDVLPALYLMTNDIAPPYISRELGIGSQVMSTAVKEISGITSLRMKELHDKLGDIGDVAFEAKVKVQTLIKPPPLIIHKVYSELVRISSLKGTGVVKTKSDIVQKLLISAQNEEVRYLTRTLVRNLRIGAVRTTLTTCLARAFTISKPAGAVWGDGSFLFLSEENRDAKTGNTRWKDVCTKADAVVKKVYVIHPNFEDIIPALLDVGLDGLEDRVRLQVGTPLSPMLGSITRSFSQVFETLPPPAKFTCEAKLDGQRGQIHCKVVKRGDEGANDGTSWVDHPFDVGLNIGVKIFSRHLDDMTEKYPDIVALAVSMATRQLDSVLPPSSESLPPHILAIYRSSKITSFIIDAEIVALDSKTGALQNFQTLASRGKKGVKLEDVKVRVGVFGFDLMLINGVELLDCSLRVRRDLKRTFLPPLVDDGQIGEGSMGAKWDHIDFIDSTDPEEVKTFFQKVVAEKAEGLMVKLLEKAQALDVDDSGSDNEAGVSPKKKSTRTKDSPESGNESDGESIKPVKVSRKKEVYATYQPDMRTASWLKVKKDYIKLDADGEDGDGTLGDSLDLVPIAAWHGMGRKAAWWSPVLLACYNPDSGMFEGVSKCMSGFTDAFYKDLKQRYPDPKVVSHPKTSRVKPSNYDVEGLHPDVWFDGSEVWEIKGADITLSPTYTAAASLLGGERGISIRFPRMIRVRDDKGVENATTSHQFAAMYHRQERGTGKTDTLGDANEMEE